MSLKIPISIQIKELEEELTRRSKTYPHDINTRKLLKSDAEHRNNCLKATIELLKDIEKQRNAEQKSLF